MEINKIVDFMYESRFKNWPHSKQSTSKLKLRKLMKIFRKKMIYSSAFEKRSKRYAQIILVEKNTKKSKGYFCTFDYRVKSPDAKKWIIKEVKKILKKYHDISFEVSANYKPLIKMIGRYNYQVQNVSSVSEVKKSEIIFANKKNNNIPSEYRIRELKTRDISIVLKLIAGEFKKRPQHGRSLYSKEFLDNFNEMLIKEIEGQHSQFVITSTKGKLLGHFGCFLSLEDPFWGRKGSMHFCLHKSIQGKGLLNLMYTIIFDEMNKHKIKIFTGSTSHPAILKRSQYMKRIPFAVNLIQDVKCYELDHFKSFLKL